MKQITLTDQELDCLLNCIENEYGDIIALDKKSFLTKLYLKLKKLYEQKI
jgi:hypothetical protein